MHANDVLQIQFDRLLAPVTITRQSILLLDENAPANSPTPTVSYDPVARTVTLGPQAGIDWLKPGLAYKVILRGSPSDPNAVRAIDGATLYNPVGGSGPDIVYGFQVVAEANPPPAVREPAMRFCFDILPIFQRGCAATTCHGAPRPSSDPRFGGGLSSPAAGLVLETSEGVRRTALNRASNGSNTGPLAGQGEPPGRLFGVDMPIIDTRNGGDPGNSWLLYKVLLAPPPPNPTTAIQPACGGVNSTDGRTQCASQSDCNATYDHTGTVCGGNGLCADGCARDGDCPAGATCNSGRCSIVPPKPLGACDPSDTAKFPSCIAPTCAKDEDCGAPVVPGACDTQKKQCAPTTCKTDADCGAPAFRRFCDRETQQCAVAIATRPVDVENPPNARKLAFKTALDDIERAILSDYVIGSQMPYPNMSTTGAVLSGNELTFDELERVRMWIAQGAPIDECGACEACGPSNCKGCCDTRGRCVDGSRPVTCGQNGAACVTACPAGQSCKPTDPNAPFVGACQ